MGFWVFLSKGPDHSRVQTVLSIIFIQPLQSIQKTLFLFFRHFLPQLHQTPYFIRPSIQIYPIGSIILMKIQIDDNNYLQIDLQNGGRITRLVLNGHTIIHASPPFSDTGSGNFLMFPWISKAPENPYHPEQKNHYHGFCINTPREVEINYLNAHQLSIRVKQVEQHAQRHNFEERYTLGRGKLSIHFIVIQNEKDKNPYCFGYHPYLQIDGKPLQELQLKTDICTLLEFEENTLPIYPFQRRKVKIDNKGSYNNLFQGGSYFELISKEGTHAKISSTLPYWQVYNPADRTKIAIEPASFCGNLYNIHQQDPTIQLAKEGRITFQVWND